MASSIYLVTPITKARYIPTEFLHPTSRYFITPIEKARYFSTIPYKTTSRYFVTPISTSRYIAVNGEPDEDNVAFRYLPPVEYPQAPTLDYPNFCHYPAELDLIRQKATLLIWEFVQKSMYTSINKEAWGKKDVKGYYDAGNLRILLDYLSSIWIEKNTDSKSGLVRTSDYYYTTYNIKDIIANFRNCNLNIKEIVALFGLDSYTIIDGDWPNYFVINAIINPITEEGTKTLKQWTDIFTLESITADSNQSRYNLNNAQQNFTLTKPLKYLTSFLINGSDYIGYVDYNTAAVTYVPSGLGYTISSSDTVTITYWYEE
jgi:hypothetical protein